MHERKLLRRVHAQSKPKYTARITRVRERDRYEPRASVVSTRLDDEMREPSRRRVDDHVSQPAKTRILAINPLPQLEKHPSLIWSRTTHRRNLHMRLVSEPSNTADMYS